MIITSSPTPLRVQRFFPRITWLMIQVRQPFTLTIAHEQGEVQAAAGSLPDGIQLTQANTGGTGSTAPFVFPWKGELWHIASAANSQWSLIIIGEHDVNAKQDDESQQSSQSKLDYAIRGRNC